MDPSSMPGELQRGHRAQGEKHDFETLHVPVVIAAIYGLEVRFQYSVEIVRDYLPPKALS